MRGQTTERLLELICEMLDGRAYTARSLEEFRLEQGISRRQLHRDLDQISKLRRLVVEVRHVPRRGTVEGKSYRIMDHKLVKEAKMPKIKWCTGCKAHHNWDKFHKDGRSPDGLQSNCRDCKNKWRKEWLAKPKNRNKRNAYRRRYAKRKRMLERMGRVKTVITGRSEATI